MTLSWCGEELLMRRKISGLLLIVVVVLSVWYERSGVYAQGGAKCTSDDYLHRVAISPSGKYVLAGAWNYVRLWEAATGRLIKQFDAERDRRIESAVFSPDEQQVLIGEHGKATLWNIKLGQQVRVFSDMYIATFTDDGEWILGTNYGRFDIRNTKSGAKLGEFEQYAPYEDRYVEAQVSTSKTFLLTQHPVDSFNVWEIRSRKLIQSFKGASARLSPDDKHILLYDWLEAHGRLTLRRLTDGRQIWSSPYEPAIPNPEPIFVVRWKNWTESSRV
jgi:hypothetical protein